MTFSIKTNISSFRAQTSLRQSTNRLNKSLLRVSTGLRINSASDDAAGLSIVSQQGAQIRALNQGTRNAGDGTSLIQVADGSLNERSNILTRLKELSVQAANGTTSAQQKATLNEEFQSLVSELDRIDATTEFNGINPLNGEDVDLQVGADGGENSQISIEGVQTSSLSGLSIDTAENALSALSEIDTAIADTASQRGELGAVSNRLEYAQSNNNSRVVGLEESRSRLQDVEVDEFVKLAAEKIRQQAGTAILAQANQQPSRVLALLS